MHFRPVELTIEELQLRGYDAEFSKKPEAAEAFRQAVDLILKAQNLLKGN